VNRTTLVLRSLGFFWRGNLAVVGGVAIAVAVLAGALLVGESVRGTLRDLAVSRLGATDVVVVAPGFVREQLAADLQTDAAFASTFDGVTPALVLEGFVTAQATGRKAGRVRVYGVDDRFWRFHGIARGQGLDDRRAFVSPGLAEETGAKPGDAILVRVAAPSEIPIESLHGRKENHGRSIRADVQAILQEIELGEFSLSSEQGSIRAVFLPLARVQRELDLDGRVNTLLVSTRAGPGASELSPILRRAATIDDLGLTVRALSDSRTLSIGAGAGLIDHTRVAATTQAASSTGLQSELVSTYLANSIQIGARSLPYSLVTAIDAASMRGLSEAERPAVSEVERSIVLNSWAARDLRARIGDAVTLDYYFWEDPGQLVTRTARFRVAAVTPIEPGHRELAPVYPGISDSPTLDDWDPPFPLDLSRVRKADEDYWREYRTTPKAFIRLEDGQRLWGSRYGNVTSILVRAADGGAPASWQSRFETALRGQLDVLSTGMIVRDVRADAIAASAGVTDFGQYFVYFSFFLVVSALVLAALFFKLGVEQRVREIGLLGAVGAERRFIGRVFMAEALVLSTLGGILGAGGAVGYAAGIVYLLRTRWVDAIGTSALELHVSAAPLVMGTIGGVLAALACTWLALRSLRAITPRALLAGATTSSASELRGSANRWRRAAIAALTGAVTLIVAGVAGAVPQAGAFFGGASLMLLTGLAVVSYWYHRPSAGTVHGRGWLPLARLGFRSAASRPVRSALTIAVVAAATFIVIAVDAFRKDAVVDAGPKSGVGGYALVIESLLPLVHDLGTPAGREATNLMGIDDVRFEPFRLKPGDDTSCLNLYQPVSPRILGVRRTFADAGRFSFQSSLAATDAERANPWLLLWRRFDDGAIPVIADASSLAYVLHKTVGEDITMENGGGTLRLRVVAALSDSLFQREILIGEQEFVRAFPHQQGYRFLLAETPAARTVDVTARIEDGLSSFGADVTRSADRLAEFHRVENTYLATFQTLGGLGLLLGTIGLAAVLLRSVLERRRELALLGAVGYEPRHLRLMLLAESGSLLMLGLVIGAVAAAVATLPAVLERGGRLPISTTVAVLLALIVVAGTVATVLAARLAIRQPLLDALRSE
jgi:ABC-type lipoprotein release transport system permease subunit